jgi:hypothetical protein
MFVLLLKNLAEIYFFTNLYSTVTTTIFIIFRSFSISVLATAQSWREPDQEAEPAVGLRRAHLGPAVDQLRRLPACPEQRGIREKEMKLKGWKKQC